MTFRQHKEGRIIVGMASATVIILGYFLVNYAHPILAFVLIIIMLILYGWIISFFRNPIRILTENNSCSVWAPADGKVVVIEKTNENEYFKDERIQVSIFMSIFNVHVNRAPMSGTIPYAKYHPGKFLVAWHPKSSSENERNTVVIENDHGAILVRQIAGLLARRIVYYFKKGDQLKAGEDIGFIKFGSRVDIFLPPDAELKVNIGDQVKGNKSCIALLKED